METYSAKYYDSLRIGSRSSAEQIVPQLLHYVPANSVVDVGCGVGSWLAVFQEQGVRDVWGVDGPHVPRDALQIPANRFQVHDLQQPMHAPRRFDLAVSVEVAEHLPEESASAFIDSLTDLAPAVAFSAAVPGQGGEHHVNEQWPSYWIERFAQHDFRCFDVIRRHIWDDPQVAWWYAQNLFLFVHEDWVPELGRLEAAAMAYGLPAGIVHPMNLVQSAWRQRTSDFCLSLATHLPQRAQVAVMDDGKLAPLRLGPLHQWNPFPDHDGTYWGRPADDHQAINELSGAIYAGCDFLAVAWPAFWWLDYYAAFRERLAQCSLLRYADDLLQLFEFVQD